MLKFTCLPSDPSPPSPPFEDEPQTVAGKIESILRRLLTKRNYYYHMEQVHLNLYTSKAQSWRLREEINRMSLERVQTARAANQQRWVDGETTENFERRREKLRISREKLEKEKVAIKKAVERAEKMLEEYEKRERKEKEYVWFWQNCVTIHL